MIIGQYILNSAHIHAIKPIHAKIKGVVRAFDKANDALELVKLISAPFKLEEEYKALKDQLEYAQKTAAVQLGLRHPSAFRVFCFLNKNRMSCALQKVS